MKKIVTKLISVVSVYGLDEKELNLKNINTVRKFSFLISFNP